MRRCSGRKHRSRAAFVGAVVVPAPGEYNPHFNRCLQYVGNVHIDNTYVCIYISTESISLPLLHGSSNHNNRAKW